MTDHQILFAAPMVRALLDGRKTQTRRILPESAFTWDKFVNRSFSGWQVEKLGPSRFILKANCVGAEIVTPIQAGDRLWVKETHYLWGHWEKVPTEEPLRGFDPDGPRKMKRRFIRDESKAIEFDVEPHRLTKGMPIAQYGLYKRPSLFMQKIDSRLTLTVTDVRVQRLQDISEQDAIAEGIEKIGQIKGVPTWANYSNGPTLLSDGGLIMATASFHSLWDSINGPDAWDASPWVVAYTFTVEKRNIDA